MQIFIPHKTGANPEHLRAVGLEELLREGDCGPSGVDLIGVGPDGQSRGVVFQWPRSTSNPGFHPDRQTWHCLRGGSYWIGFDNGHPPGPQELERDAAARLDGYPVTLADGRDWIVPNGMLLPWRLTLGEGGQPQRRPKREFQVIHDRTLWALSQAEKLLTLDDEIDWREGSDYAAFMLSLNYRVNLEICLVLELFDGSNLGKLIARSTDLDKLREIALELAQKKTASVRPA